MSEAPGELPPPSLVHQHWVAERNMRCDEKSSLQDENWVVQLFRVVVLLLVVVFAAAVFFWPWS